MKPRKINLNQWERVNNEEDLDDYQSLIITPLKTNDGTQLPDLYFRKGIPKNKGIENIEGIKWTKDTWISKEGGDDEYATRVDWWYENASNNEEYKKIINTSFNKNGFDVRKAWNQSQNYLKKFNYSARKTYIHRYVWNWLVSNMHQHLKFKK